jgi:hypothetical protein
MSTAGIAVFASHGMPALRSVLRGIRETAGHPASLMVFVSDCPEQAATYLVRQYLRGRINGFELDTGAHHLGHCGLDRAFHMLEGDYLVRVDDTMEFRPRWLEKALAALENNESIGCLSLVQPPEYHRGRGRPRTVHVEPVPVERLDMRCYVTRHDLAARHECELMGEKSGGTCLFQQYLRREGRELAYLPGLVRAGVVEDLPRPGARLLDQDLPVHEGPTGALQRLRRTYELGDDVLFTCMACGAREHEVLAMRARFCERHHVAVGCWYELRCLECHELHYVDDDQYRCPV